MSVAEKTGPGPEEAFPQYVEAQETRDVMQALMATEGWKRLHQMLKEQAFAREKIIIRQPLKSADQAFAVEYQKGEIGMAELVMNWPLVKLNEANELLNMLGDDNE